MTCYGVIIFQWGKLRVVFLSDKSIIRDHIWAIAINDWRGKVNKIIADPKRLLGPSKQYLDELEAGQRVVIELDNLNEYINKEK